MIQVQLHQAFVLVTAQTTVNGWLVIGVLVATRLLNRWKPVIFAIKFSKKNLQWFRGEYRDMGDKREPDSWFYKSQGSPRCKEYISRDLGENIKLFFYGFVRSGVEIFFKKRGSTVRGSCLIVSFFLIFHMLVVVTMTSAQNCHVFFWYPNEKFWAWVLFHTFSKNAPAPRPNAELGGGFKHYLCSPMFTLGKWSNLTYAYLSNGWEKTTN